MASRLDRLFVLLESGSSAVTRKAAANQLGEVQRLHPHELHNLLKTVLTYLKSTSWDTRIAAGWAVEAILKKVPQWDPIGLPDDGVNGCDSIPELSGRLSCDNFNVVTILESSSQLMGSEGKEYETSANSAGDSRESLEAQKQILNQKLNLEAAARLGFDTNVLYTIDDLKIEPLPKCEEKGKLSIKEVVGLSCREVNRAKRKARQAMIKQRSKEKSFQQSDEDEEPEKKKVKIEPSTEEDIFLAPVPDNTNCWPLNMDHTFRCFESVCL